MQSEEPCKGCKGSGKCSNCFGTGIVHEYELQARFDERLREAVAKRRKLDEQAIIARLKEIQNVPHAYDPRDVFDNSGPFDKHVIVGIHSIDLQRGTAEDIRNFVDNLQDVGGVILADSKTGQSHLSRRQRAIQAAEKDNVPWKTEVWRGAGVGER